MSGELTKNWRETNSETLTNGEYLLEELKKTRRDLWEKDYKNKYEKKSKDLPSGWKGRYTEPESPDAEDQQSLPDEWIWTSFGEAFRVYLGSTPRRSNEEYWEGDISWVSSGEVNFCRIKKSEEKITEVGLENASTEIHPPGTILMGIIGQGKTRGQAAILDIPAAHNQNTVAIRVSEAGLPPEFIYYYLMSHYEETRRLGSGNQQKALNKTKVQQMLFPLPPKAEQQKIVNMLEKRLSVIDQIERVVDENLKRADKLRKSILYKAFDGGLMTKEHTNTDDDETNSEISRTHGKQIKLSEVNNVK